MKKIYKYLCIIALISINNACEKDFLKEEGFSHLLEFPRMMQDPCKVVI